MVRSSLSGRTAHLGWRETRRLGTDRRWRWYAQRAGDGPALAVGIEIEKLGIERDRGKGPQVRQDADRFRRKLQLAVDLSGEALNALQATPDANRECLVLRDAALP